VTAQYGPVEIPGFTLQRPLGSGGYADVFLYEQHLPRRPVAVKIMHAPVDDPAARARFESEANLMAALSTHPSIVTIHHAAVADNGRPYLVMEYCSLPTLAEAYPHRLVSVPELLQTLVRLCGAVETAHRAGILHRDIKPANVLTTDYGWPALTDFGLSSIAGADSDAGGVSVPWAAPEVVSGRDFDARSDVYALAATAYTVLARRTPFEDPGARTDLTALVTRVLTQPAPPIGRADVPPTLEQLILAALAKDPDRRSQTASEFARSLQRIEQDLHLPVTNLDIPALTTAAAPPEPPADDADLPERTRLAPRRRAAIDPVAAPEERTALSARSAAGPRADPGETDDDEATRLSESRRPQSPLAADDTGEPDEPDHTVLSARVTAHAAAPDAPAPGPADDATVLAARGPRRPDASPDTPAPGPADDATVLAARGPRRTDAPTGSPGDAGPHEDDGTQLAARRPRSGNAEGAPGARGTAGAPAPGGRTARDPGASSAPEAYGIRRAPAPAPVVRSAPAPAAPAQPMPSAAPRPGGRRRRVVTTAVAVGATAALIAACIAGITLLVGI